jgi:ATP-dependent Zn protease
MHIFYCDKSIHLLNTLKRNTILNILSFVLPLAFLFFIMRRGMSSMGGMGMPGMGGGGGKSGSGSRGGMFGFGQSTARIIKENTGVTFK